MTKRLKITLWLAVPALLSTGLAGLYWKYAAFHPAPSNLRTHENIENIIVAVAPFKDYKSAPTPVVNMQEKIATHMEKDLGLKALRLSQPVSLGPPGQDSLAKGFENAEKVLDETGADLLIWGTEDVQANGDKKWITYVSASTRAQCLARESGFSIHSTADLDSLAEGDVLDVLDVVTYSWRGLLQQSEGMDISPKIQALIPKMNTLLGMGEFKRWSQGTKMEVERNLAFLLCQYGEKRKDVTSLRNAIRLSRDVLSKSHPDLETGSYYEDLDCVSTLGASLMNLGELQADPRNIEEAVQLYEKTAKSVSHKSDPLNWTVYQMDLGHALAELGHRRADTALIDRSIQAFEGALPDISREGQPHEWQFVQTGLGACYLFRGERSTDDGDLKKAITHFQAAEAKDAKVLAPDDYAMAEVNLGVIYFTLGEREESAEDMRQAVLHTRNGQDQFQAMGNPYGVGFALNSLGMAQLRLAQYTNDDAMIGQAQESLRKSESMVPQAQDATLWANNQTFLATSEEYLGTKTCDAARFQTASDIYRQSAAFFEKQNRKPIWITMVHCQCQADLMLARIGCEAGREEKALKTLDGLLKETDPQAMALRYTQIEYTMGSALNQKGEKDRDPEDFQQSVSVLEDALSRTSAGNLDNIRCSLRSGLVDSYSRLLNLKPDGATLAKAKALLEPFEKECESSAIVADRANHMANSARLEGAIARIEKDEARLATARQKAQSALNLFQANGYVYYAARTQEVLGDLDLLEGQWTGDRELMKRAQDEFRDAQKVMRVFGECWVSGLGEKMAQAQKLVEE